MALRVRNPSLVAWAVLLALPSILTHDRATPQASAQSQTPLKNSLSTSTQQGKEKWPLGSFRKSKPTFAPGLVALLQRQAPPTLQELKDVTNIEPTKDNWGVYLLFLEKMEEADLYTGSGTNISTGIRGGVRTYGTQAAIPIPARHEYSTRERKGSRSHISGSYSRPPNQPREIFCCTAPSSVSRRPPSSTRSGPRTPPTTRPSGDT